MLYRWACRAMTVALCLVVLCANAAHVTAADQPAAADRLPRVLILGDSISLGYTPVVRMKLKGQAEVLRPNENCQHTGHGVARIKMWMGREKWDVIHFNWGIWDTHMLDEQNALVRDEARAKGPLHIRHTPEQYREHLTQLVKTMEDSGARLIWASTTPIMSRTGKRFDDIKILNTVAAELMDSRKIRINDLYEFTLPHAKDWQTGDKVHFNMLGNEKLGQQVADSILQALKTKPASTAPLNQN